MAAADHANATQLAGHMPTNPGSCQTPFSSLLASASDFGKGNLGGLSVPAACPPGSMPMSNPCNAPIHPNAAASTATTTTKAIASSVQHPNAGGGGLTQPLSSSGATRFKDHNEMVAAMKTDRGLGHGEMKAMQDKKTRLTEVKASIDLPFSMAQLAANPDLAKVHVPWNKISKGIDCGEKKGVLLGLAVKSKCGGMACPVRLDCDKVDSTEHLEYHPRSGTYGITFWGPNESAPGPVDSSNQTRFMRTFDRDVASALEHVGTPEGAMFSKENCGYVDMGGSSFYTVKCDSKEGRAIVNVADAEERKRQEAQKTGSVAPKCLFAQHPRNWGKIQIGDGAVCWNVDAPIIEDLKAKWVEVKKKDLMQPLADGVNFTFSRADGKDNWADVSNVCAELGDNSQQDVLENPGNIKADVHMVFMLPPEARSS